MGYEEDIAAEEANISRLQEEARRITIPRKSINYQFQNMRYGNRNVVQSTAIKKMQRRNLLKGVETSKVRVLSLREALIKSLEMLKE